MNWKRIMKGRRMKRCSFSLIVPDRIVQRYTVASLNLNLSWNDQFYRTYDFNDIMQNKIPNMEILSGEDRMIFNLIPNNYDTLITEVQIMRNFIENISGGGGREDQCYELQKVRNSSVQSSSGG